METDKFIHDYCKKSISCVNILAEKRGEIEVITRKIFAAWKEDRNVFVIGNGGSASTATHFASDLFKTTVNSPEEHGIRALSFDNIPLGSAIVNDWGKENLYIHQLKTLLKSEDILIVFSVHGGFGGDKDGLWSQNLIRAIKYAKENSVYTVGFSGFDGGLMGKICDVCITVPVDSTPLVESFHLWLSHAITFMLKELINEQKR